MIEVAGMMLAAPFTWILLALIAGALVWEAHAERRSS